MCRPKSLLCAEKHCNNCKNKIDIELFNRIEKCCVNLAVKWIRYERTDRLIVKVVNNTYKIQEQENKTIRDYVQKSGEISVMLNQLLRQLQPFAIHPFNVVAAATI